MSVIIKSVINFSAVASVRKIAPQNFWRFGDVGCKVLTVVIIYSVDPYIV